MDESKISEKKLNTHAVNLAWRIAHDEKFINDIERLNSFRILKRHKPKYVDALRKLRNEKKFKEYLKCYKLFRELIQNMFGFDPGNIDLRGDDEYDGYGSCHYNGCNYYGPTIDGFCSTHYYELFG